MAKSIKAPATPEVLQWARETSGLSIDEVALKLKKRKSYIESLESGKEMPSYALLEKLADKLYKRPVAIFFMPKPPKLDDLTKDFRTLPDSVIKSLSSQIRLIIRRSKFKQMVLNEMNQNKPVVEHPVFKTFKINKNRYPYQEAQRLVTVLKYNKDEQPIDPREAFNYVRNLVENNGVFIFQEPLTIDDARGFSLMDENFPIIVVSSKDHHYAKIFTIIHELCHILFNTGGIFRDSDTKKLKKDAKEIETFCNQFAADFLVNDSTLKTHPIVSKHDSLEWENTILKELSRQFRVSKEVILRKLLKLGLSTQAFYNKKRKEWQDKGYSKKKLSNGGPSFYRKHVSQLGKNYVTLVLGNLHNNKISSAQASEYLNIKINQISRVENEVYA